MSPDLPRDVRATLAAHALLRDLAARDTVLRARRGNLSTSQGAAARLATPSGEMRIAGGSERMSADVWTDLEARGLLLDLEARGIVLSVRRGNLASRQAGVLTDSDRALLVRYKAALLLLVLACDERTLVRLARLHASEVGAPVLLPGLCRDCGDSLPPTVRWGVCGWCAIARRQHARAPLPESLLEVFPAELVGRYARGGGVEVGAGSPGPRGRVASVDLFARPEHPEGATTITTGPARDRRVSMHERMPSTHERAGIAPHPGPPAAGSSNREGHRMHASSELDLFGAKRPPFTPRRASMRAFRVLS